MYSERVTRGEKLSNVKLTSVQYGILLMMVALTAGLWRLQVLGADNFKVLAEQNRVRKVPMLAPRGKLFVILFRAPPVGWGRLEVLDRDGVMFFLRGFDETQQCSPRSFPAQGVGRDRGH